ncbi:MAG: hypothetical protein ACFE9Z_17450 [Promethearchaeota archaeon]
MEKINILRLSDIFIVYVIILCFIGDIFVPNSVFNTFNLFSKILFVSGLVLTPIVLLLLSSIFLKSTKLKLVIIILGIITVLLNIYVLAGNYGYID